MSSGAAKRRSSGSPFSLSCGCRDSKSVSVSDGSERSTATPRRPREPSSSAEALTLTSASSSSPYCWGEEEGAERSGTPSFSGLLRQLRELERSVIAWRSAVQAGEEENRRRQGRRRLRRCRSEGGTGRVGESVAVVTETADPMGDFQRSMLQMIVEKEIVGGEELRELLRRFLALNSPRHHDTILRAFADIWADVFSGFEHSPDHLRRRSYADARRPTPRHRR